MSPQGGAGAGSSRIIVDDACVEDMRARTPGGRHSNDHADFRSIAIVPTADEVSYDI